MTPVHLAQAEGSELDALLSTLSPQQWDAASLCAGWRVRDVVAHLVSSDGLGATEVARRLVRGRVRPGARTPWRSRSRPI